MTRRTPATARGELRGALPVVGAIASDQAMNRHDGERIDGVVDATERAPLSMLPGRSSWPGRCSEGRRRKESRCARPATRARSRRRSSAVRDATMLSGRHFRPSFRRATRVRANPFPGDNIVPATGPVGFFLNSAEVIRLYYRRSTPFAFEVRSTVSSRPLRTYTRRWGSPSGRRQRDRKNLGSSFKLSTIAS